MTSPITTGPAHSAPVFPSRLHDATNAAWLSAGRPVTESLEPVGAFRSSVLDRARTRDPLTLLALRVRGQTLHPEHGYPVRLTAPNRPGVLQTRWVSTVVVL